MGWLANPILANGSGPATPLKFLNFIIFLIRLMTRVKFWLVWLEILLVFLTAVEVQFGYMRISEVLPVIESENEGRKNKIVKT
jgi:hypothetical protein